MRAFATDDLCHWLSPGLATRSHSNLRIGWLGIIDKGRYDFSGLRRKCLRSPSPLALSQHLTKGSHTSNQFRRLKADENDGYRWRNCMRNFHLTPALPRRWSCQCWC